MSCLKHTESERILPRIQVFGCGGTIAGVGEEGNSTNYVPGALSIETLLESIPEIATRAQIRGEQICNVNSDDISSSHWIEIARRIALAASHNEADGFVVVHGTDTLEETAYALDLLLHIDKPVVVVGSMRPSTAHSCDGPANLLQAITTAASPLSHGRGVLVVCSNQIIAARQVSKVSSYHLQAFSGGDAGSEGYVIDDDVVYYRPALSRCNNPFVETLGDACLAMQGSVLTCVFEQNELPLVGIAYFHAEADAGVLSYFVQRGTAAIIIAGAGSGCYSLEWIAESNRLGDMLPIIRLSRIGENPVSYDGAYEGPVVIGPSLSPSKGAVLIRIACAYGVQKEALAALCARA